MAVTMASLSASRKVMMKVRLMGSETARTSARSTALLLASKFSVAQESVKQSAYLLSSQDSQANGSA